MKQPDAIRALSLWQPWASLIACGAKRIETRSWDTSVRGDVAIHAAKTLKGIELIRGDRRLEELFEEKLCMPIDRWKHVLPFGEIVAVGELVSTMKVEDFPPAVSFVQRDFGDFTPGRYGHVYADVRRVKSSKPVIGRQGFFWTTTDNFEI